MLNKRLVYELIKLGKLNMEIFFLGSIHKALLSRHVETRGGVDLLSIDNDGEKKKIAKQYELVQIPRKLLVTLLLFTSYNRKMMITTLKNNLSLNHAFSIGAINHVVYFIETIMPFPLGLYSIGAMNHAISIEAMFKH